MLTKTIPGASGKWDKDIRVLRGRTCAWILDPTFVIKLKRIIIIFRIEHWKYHIV
jgi:hypothetical protein